MSISEKGQPSSIFISYRIADTFHVADRLAAELKQMFGRDTVFFDNRSIEAGERWDSRLEHEIQNAKVALILIGKKWLTVQNEYGIRRLDEEDDWVRRELEIALSQEGRVLPLLIDDTPLPPKEAFHNLPALKGLTLCQAIDLRTKEWDRDFQELVEALKKKGFEVQAESNSSIHKNVKLNLRSYLGQFIEKYRWLKLQNLREAGSLLIELEKVYIALKAEPESEYERQQSSKLHEVEVLDKAGVESTDVINPIKLEDLQAENIRETHRPGREAVKRARITQVHTFGDAFRQHHRIVVLGGPGSGKTTLGQWLALQLATAHAHSIDTNTEENVTVLRSRIDPDINFKSEELADLGPVRLPIFLRLSHYARELTRLNQNGKPAKSLVEYLGRDPDNEELEDGMDADSRNELFRTHITDENAVVILDGLDELSELNRGAVVSKVQSFILDHTPLTDSDSEMGLPYEEGGNQVIVTSRYVGYNYHPVRANCSHFGVQPMRRPAVERFIYSWCEAVNEVLTPSKHKGVNADKLILEIYSSDKPKIRELATNPLLITILGTVYWRDGKLPSQRAGIYDRVIESLVEVWLKREECKQLTREQLLAALEPLAADLQENASDNGLVSLKRISEIIEAPLAQVSGIIDPSDRRFRDQLDGLLKTIRKHVGLLAEQSTGNYAFFHRTFQEFLAARHLLVKRASAAQKISEKLDDPIWRQPLLLALGYIMIHWEREQQVELLNKVLDIDGKDVRVPRATFLLTDALLEIHEVPTKVSEQIVTRLLTSYSISMKQIQARGLGERIEQMFIRLRKGSQTNVVTRLLADTIRSPGEKHDLTYAAANVIRQIDWYTDDIVNSLLVAANRDKSDLGWPVCKALIKALNQRSNEKRWIDIASPQMLTRLESAHLPMRKLLNSKPNLVSFIRKDHDWLALLIALYGGLDQTLSFDELHRYQQQPIDIIKSTLQKPTVLVEQEAAAPPLFASTNFSPKFIFWDLQDKELSRLIMKSLTQQQPAQDLLVTFIRKWENGSGAEAVEALVGMAALGEDVIPLLHKSLTDPERQKMTQAAIERFSQLRFLLVGPMVQASETLCRTIPEDIPENHQLDLLRIILNTHISCGGAPLKVGADWPEYNFITTSASETTASVDAEFWAYIFSGAIGKAGEKSFANSVLRSIVCHQGNRLLKAWSQIPYSVNHTAQHHLAWPQPFLAQRADSTVECYLSMLEAMESIPIEYHSIAGYVLAECRFVMDRSPLLLWETVSLCDRMGEAFTRSYQMNRDAPRDETSEFQAILDRCLVLIATTPDSDLSPETVFEDSKLSDHISSIIEPYLQFRTFNYSLYSLEDTPSVSASDLLNSIQHLPQSVDRVRAIELLLMNSPELTTSSEGLRDIVDKISVVIPEIQDSENRARTFGRLAMFVPNQTKSLLKGAIEALNTISDSSRKAFAIDEIRTFWGRIPEIDKALDKVAETITDTWERDKALGHMYRLVSTHRKQSVNRPLSWRLSNQNRAEKEIVFRHDGTNSILGWHLLYLFNLAEAAEQIGSRSTNSDALWDQLLSDSSASIAGLLSIGQEEGIPISTRNASILDQFLQENRTSEIEQLWPYLIQPEPGAMGTISRWSAHPGRPGQWSALVQAEKGRLTPEIVSSLIELLGNSTDLLRLRASLAIHGTTPYTNNSARRWRVSLIGPETLNVLAREVKRSFHSQAILTTLNIVKHDIHHDNTLAIKNWLHELSELGKHSPAAWLIRGMESAETEVVSVLLSTLPSARADTQIIILAALARLSYCSKSSCFPSGDFNKTIAVVPEDIRIRLSILPKGTETLLNSVRDAVNETQSGYAWRQALKFMRESSLWLDEESLNSRKACIERLRVIGEQEYITAGQLDTDKAGTDARNGLYWSKTDKAALGLVEDERIQETLIALLAEVETTNDYIGYSRHLLTATEAVAHKSPDAFARLATPKEWEPVLTEWAQYRSHWSERLAAVRLLGKLRRVTPSVIQALGAAMEDDPYNQHAAYSVIGEFRKIEGDVFQDVLTMLDNPSASTSAAMARLLVSAVKAGIEVEKRRQIINAIEETLKKPSAKRPIFLMEVGFSGVMSPGFVGRLDEILYRSILEISDS